MTDDLHSLKDDMNAFILGHGMHRFRATFPAPFEEVMKLGRVNPQNKQEPFCMTVLALKLSRAANGVSELHGRVSRHMWHCLYPNKPVEQVPIGHITNGVHVPSWVAPQMHQLLDRHLATDWTKRQQFPETWTGVQTIEDAELWETQQILDRKSVV